MQGFWEIVPFYRYKAYEHPQYWESSRRILDKSHVDPRYVIAIGRQDRPVNCFLGVLDNLLCM